MTGSMTRFLEKPVMCRPTIGMCLDGSVEDVDSLGVQECIRNTAISN